jgi:hypothetical protein
MNVRILRLKNGDDIICDMEKDGDTYYINSPMLIWMENNGKVPKLCMDHWLPIQVVEDNAVTLTENDILTTMLPNSSLLEYYINTIDEMNSVLRAKEEADKMSDDDIIDTLLALQEGFGSTLH